MRVGAFAPGKAKENWGAIREFAEFTHRVSVPAYYIVIPSRRHRIAVDGQVANRILIMDLTNMAKSSCTFQQ